MVMVLARAFSFGIVGIILALVFATIAENSDPNGHLLILQGQNAFSLVAYCSAFFGGGFGAVIGAISGAAELIAAGTRRDQLKDVQPTTRPPTGKPG
jgi:hypothetical protein